ncbi:histidine--tRNA ligase [Candidatus Shapirobacteria bacterium]|nr:histidine--tRNA ligase [Candidatus Shapirobacteria bacterium]
MRKANLQPLKGFRDFLPDQARKKEFVLNTLKEVFSCWGFEPLETPALEYTSTLLGKSGLETEKLIYKFKDQGGREIGLRYDLTIPLARFIAANQNLNLPFKRYQIQPVWRADKPQAGRFREFWQADIDIIGSKSNLSDAEIIKCALGVMAKLGFKEAQMVINDREIFKNYGLSLKSIIELDKKEKEGPKPFLAQLIKEGKTGKEAQEIFEKITRAKKTKSLEELFSLVNGYQVSFDPSLARGLDYYTSIIFELRVPGYDNLSLGGGGRYDNLIKQLSGKDLPAVGFSFGIDRLIEAMEKKGLFKNIKTSPSQVLITVFSKDYLENSLKILSLLRKQGIASEIYLDEGKLDKQIKYADKKGIKYVVILGPDEIKKNEVTIKDLSSGRQSTVALDKINQFFGF